MSSSHTRRSSASSGRTVTTISTITGARASTSLVAIFLGLLLRVVLHYVLPNSPKLEYTLIGLWEGPVLHHFVSSSISGNYDPYVGFGARIFVDFVVSEADIQRLVLIALWTCTSFVFADIAPDIWKATGMRRPWHKFRRQLYIMGSRVRRWSPTRIWKSRTPPPPKRATTIRFDDFPLRHSASTSRPRESVRNAPRDTVSILSSSSYTQSSVSTATNTNTNTNTNTHTKPPSLLTGASSMFTSYAPSFFSRTVTKTPSVVSQSESESTVQDDETDGTITPPASPQRRKIPVPPYPGYFPDNFSETGTDYSVLPTQEASISGTSHARTGSLNPSRSKGKARAPPTASDSDDMYTSSDFTEDDPLTESTTYATESTPNARFLDEIPDEVFIPPAPPRRLNTGLNDLDMDTDSTSEWEMERQRQEYEEVVSPPTATIPIIPDEARQELEALDIFGKGYSNKDPFSDPSKDALGLTEDVKPAEEKEKAEVTEPEPKAEEQDTSATPPPVPSTPPRTSRRKPSLTSMTSAGPDINVVAPSEPGETEDQWGNGGPSTSAQEPTIQESEEQDPEAPEPPPRENPYDAHPTQEQVTPPPTFQEALKSPNVDEQFSQQSLIPETPSTPLPPLPTEEPSSRLSYILTLTDKQAAMMKKLQQLERQRAAAIEEGPEGVTVAIARKDEMRRVREKLDALGEEVFEANNPWLTAGSLPDDSKPLDLSGMKKDLAVERVEMVLAAMIRENAAARRQTVMSINFDLDVSLGVDTLDNMPHASLLIQVDKGLKGKNLKALIHQTCQDQKLQVRDVGLRQMKITLPNLDSDADDER